MKPAWDKLMSTYDGSSVLVADVDCTSDGGKKVCQDNGVSGYPTIKYFTSETGPGGESYSGGRDFDALDAFVKEKLAKNCDPVTKVDCDDKQIAYIDKMQAKGDTAIKAEAKRLAGLTSGDMTPANKAWLLKRIAILKGLAPEPTAQEL